MKVLILSTETKHHTYFINKLAEYHNICGIIYERRKLKKQYNAGPFFEKEENEYENKFFDEVQDTFSNALNKKIISLHSVNDNHIRAYITSLAPDIAISFGTGIIKPYIFKIPAMGTINVHRGYIQKYRGLDSDLWAMYNKEFDNIGTTIHFVDDNLDTGAILAQENVIITKEDMIYHMRYRTTCIAAKLVNDVLKNLEKSECELNYQVTVGTYYSAMSLDNKYKALQNFQEYKELL